MVLAPKYLISQRNSGQTKENTLKEDKDQTDLYFCMVKVIKFKILTNDDKYGSFLRVNEMKIYCRSFLNLFYK